MNENINLAEILKDAPKGTKLWSPLCGECSLYGVDMSSDVPICVEVEGDKNNKECVLFFAANGKYLSRFILAECLLFPSKEIRNWAAFNAPWKHKHFEPFQKVLVASSTSEIWEPDIYGYYNDSRKRHICMIHSAYDKDIIPYKGNKNKLSKPAK